MIRVLIADDHAVVRRGLRDILAEAFNNSTFAEAGSSEEVLRKVREQDWDLVTLDIGMPGRSGLETLKGIKEIRPKLPVLVLSVHPEDQYAIRFLKTGAAGYLTKESAPLELVDAARKVLQGGRYIGPFLAERLATELASDTQCLPHESLSNREFEVLRMIASGRTVTQIANELRLSVKTVSTYRARILDKMKMKTNAELTHYAIRNQLVD
jgi:two-component system invasion response regulator UvrY